MTLVRSEEGKGSVFRVTVSDLTVAGEAAIQPEIKADDGVPEGALRGTKILVVDDSEDNRLLVRMFLSAVGASVDFAENGREGMEKALANEFDAVLMDIQMPIIAFTANAMREERERCREAGCEDYLSKPLDRNLLIRTLRNRIPERGL